MNKKLRAHLAACSAELTDRTGTPYSFSWTGNLSHDIVMLWAYTVSDGGFRTDIEPLYDSSEHGTLGTGEIMARVTAYVNKTIESVRKPEPVEAT